MLAGGAGLRLFVDDVGGEHEAVLSTWLASSGASLPVQGQGYSGLTDSSGSRRSHSGMMTLVNVQDGNEDRSFGVAGRAADEPVRFYELASVVGG